MIPTFQQIRAQVLRALNVGGVMRAKDLRTPLAKHFNLTNDELNTKYDSGNGEIFLDRISWALSYLFMAKLADKPRRGDYTISQKVKELVVSCTDEEINKYINDTVSKPRKTSGETDKVIGATIMTSNNELTPQEGLYESYENIKKSIQADILATILSKKPQAFERIVVELLQIMGYGGEIKDAGFVTKLSNDGGIDGIIKEDVLGFNHISIQAKRYAANNHVGRNEVQAFVGAVAGTPSKKGVFITTSDFTKGAIDYVESLNGTPTVILINGEQLTKYLYECGLGLQEERVFKVMKLDRDFWDAMDDE